MSSAEFFWVLDMSKRDRRKKNNKKKARSGSKAIRIRDENLERERRNMSPEAREKEVREQRRAEELREAERLARAKDPNFQYGPRGVEFVELKRNSKNDFYAWKRLMALQLGITPLKMSKVLTRMRHIDETNFSRFLTPFDRPAKMTPQLSHVIDELGLFMHQELRPPCLSEVAEKMGFGSKSDHHSMALGIQKRFDLDSQLDYELYERFEKHGWSEGVTQIDKWKQRLDEEYLDLGPLDFDDEFRWFLRYVCEIKNENELDTEAQRIIESFIANKRSIDSDEISDSQEAELQEKLKNRDRNLSEATRYQSTSGQLTKGLQGRPKENISKGLRYDVLERDGHRCRSCGANPRSDGEVILHIDHIVPESLGGPTNMDNLQTLCADCNLGKGNRYDTDLRRDASKQNPDSAQTEVEEISQPDREVWRSFDKKTPPKKTPPKKTPSKQQLADHVPGNWLHPEHRKVVKVTDDPDLNSEVEQLRIEKRRLFLNDLRDEYPQLSFFRDEALIDFARKEVEEAGSFYAERNEAHSTVGELDSLHLAWRALKKRAPRENQEVVTEARRRPQPPTGPKERLKRWFWEWGM